MKRWSALLTVLFLSAFLVVGCGKKNKGTGPVPAKQIVNELPDFEELLEMKVEHGTRLGYLILWDAESVSFDTMSACPGNFPLVMKSNPDFAIEIEEEWGIISDTMVDFNQKGTLPLIFCANDECSDFDSCVTSFEANISSRTTNQHPGSATFQLIAILKFRNCSGGLVESLTRYTFKDLAGSPNCSAQGKRSNYLLPIVKSKIDLRYQ